MNVDLAFHIDFLVYCIRMGTTLVTNECFLMFMFITVIAQGKPTLQMLDLLNIMFYFAIGNSNIWGNYWDYVFCS